MFFGFMSLPLLLRGRTWGGKAEGLIQELMCPLQMGKERWCGPASVLLQHWANETPLGLLLASMLLISVMIPHRLSLGWVSPQERLAPCDQLGVLRGKWIGRPVIGKEKSKLLWSLSLKRKVFELLCWMPEVAPLYPFLRVSDFPAALVS